MQRLSLLFLVSFCASIADTSHESTSGSPLTSSSSPFLPSRLVRGRRPIVRGSWGSWAGGLRRGVENSHNPWSAVEEMRGGGDDGFRVTEDFEAEHVPKVRDAVLKMWEVDPPCPVLF